MIWVRPVSRPWMTNTLIMHLHVKNYCKLENEQMKITLKEGRSVIAIAKMRNMKKTSITSCHDQYSLCRLGVVIHACLSSLELWQNDYIKD